MAWALWQLTDPMTDRKITVGKHTYWRHKTTGLWWSKDTAGHGGSVFKVYKKVGTTLVWIADADKYGTFIGKKHKSKKGKYLTLEIEEDWT